LSKLCAANFSTLILCILILSTLSFAAAPDRITGPIDSRQTVALARSLHPRAQPQYDRGLVDPSRPLSYITLLTSPSPSQQKALDQLLAQQQDRTSANYHKWLTPQQYADRFGLSSNDLTRITTWLTSQGFQILSIGGGRNSIVFSGTVAQVQHAFGTEIHNYTVNGEEHFANSTPLMIPSALHDIVTTVIGLHNFRAQPANRGKSFGAERNPLRNYYDRNYIFPNFLAPDDIATIYDIAPLYTAATPIDGTGQQLAIVGQTDIYLADIADFRTGFGLPAINNCTANGNGILTSCTSGSSADYLQYVLLGTDPGAPSPGDLSESDLDIEWSGAVARKAQIIFVNGETAGGVYDALVAAINPPGPPLALVVSMSYGECEYFAPDLESLLQQGNAEGVTILNSSGDVGAAACDYAPPGTTSTYTPPPPYLGAQYGLAVSYPASSPEVTGVGGTAITLANDSYPTQSSYWNTTLGANGGTAVCPEGSCVPEIPWNDDEELALYCQNPAKGDTFCSQGGPKPVTGWVKLTSTATAEQVQSDIWISIGGGGASNCWYVDINNVCLPAGPYPNGGGFPQPIYQQGLSVPSTTAGVRYVPDVSMLASPNFPGYILCTPLSELGGSGSTSSCANGIFEAVDTYGSLVGGTSASSPVFAGIVALLNQDVVQSGLQNAPGLGNINFVLYNLAVHQPNAFRQVTSGDNMVYCQATLPTGFPTACPSSGVFGFEASNKDSATGYNLVAGLGSVDAYNLASAWVGAKLAATSTDVTSSANPANYGAPVTFTATVTTTGATPPTRTVTFNDGATALGTGTLNSSQVATFTTTTLTAGTHSITAVYGGDSSNGGSTSPVLSQVIVAPTFAITTPSTPATPHSGQTTTSTFKVTPTGTTTVPITFACNGLPADGTVTCSAPPIAAGATGVQTVTLTITTTGPNSGTAGSSQRRADNRSPWLPLTLPLAGIVMVGLAGRKMSKHSAIAGLCVSLALLGLLIACGGSNPPVTISVSPAGATVFASGPAADNWPPQTATFTPTVNNTSNTAVNWTLTSTVSCTGTPNPCGSISSGGVYTAPTAAAKLPGSVTVTATSQADSTKTATATVTITPTTVPGSYPLTVTATEGPTQNTTSAFTLTVQ
jgi:subtilase family serine protease